jgi:hypothetical protein
MDVLYPGSLPRQTEELSIRSDLHPEHQGDGKGTEGDGLPHQADEL